MGLEDAETKRAARGEQEEGVEKAGEKIARDGSREKSFCYKQGNLPCSLFYHTNICKTGRGEFVIVVHCHA